MLEIKYIVILIMSLIGLAIFLIGIDLWREGKKLKENPEFQVLHCSNCNSYEFKDTKECGMLPIEFNLDKAIEATQGNGRLILKAGRYTVNQYGIKFIDELEVRE